MPRKYSRRRPSSEQKARTKKKKSMRRRSKSKKMRGGVTVRAQDLKTRLPEDMFGEIREMHPLLTPKLTNATIRRAVRDYLNGGARKQRVVAKYGEISNWDTSSVTNIAKSKIFTNGGQESVDNQNMLKNKLPGIASYLWNSQERIRSSGADESKYSRSGTRLS